MYNYHQTFVWMFDDSTVMSIYLAFMLGLIGFMLGVFSAVAACEGNDSTPESMQKARWIGTFIVTALCGVGAYLCAKYVYIEVASPFIVAILAYFAYALGAVQRRHREVRTALGVAFKLSANASAMLQALDFDRDGVVSKLDLANVKNRVLGSPFTTEEHGWLLANTHILGHRTELGHSTCIISEAEIESALRRVRELHKGWLPLE